MTRRSMILTESLHEYLLHFSLREPPLLARVRTQTAAMPRGYKQISPEQGQFMAFLVELIGARLCLEIGTFTGCSALWLASGLGDDGRIICCDIDPDASAIAKGYWNETGLADR